MNTMGDVVQRYALLQCAVENAHAHGRRADPAFYREIQRIETMARVHFTPQQLQDVMHHVEVAKMHLKQREIDSRDAAFTAYTARQIDRTARDLTRNTFGGDGLSRRQLGEAARSGKRPATPRNDRLTQAERDQISREQSKRFDPAGRGWSEKEWVRRLDALVDAKPNQRAALTRQYRDQANLQQLTNKWSNDRWEHGLAKRQAARDAEREKSRPREEAPKELNYQQRRRAVLAEAMMMQGADEMEEAGRRGERADPLELDGPSISASYLTETQPNGRPTRRAVLANAMWEQDVGETHAYGLGNDE